MEQQHTPASIKKIIANLELGLKAYGNINTRGLKESDKAYLSACRSAMTLALEELVSQMLSPAEIKSPASLESEQLVVGTCLVNSEAYDELSQIIDCSDFFSPVNATVFEAVGQVVTDGSEVSEVAVLERVRKSGLEDEIGGISGLMGLANSGSTMLAAKDAAKVVEETSKRRKIIRSSREAIEECVEGADTSEEIGAKLEAGIQKLGEKGSEDDGSISNATEALREDFNAMIDGTYEIQSLPTGIAQIDEQLDAGGIGNGEVMVLSAPTSCGKTQFALNVVLRAAVQNNMGGLYFSFEMPAKQLAKRMTQTTAACNLKELRAGTMSDDKKKRVFESLDRLEKAPIFTNHYVKSIDELRAKARMHKRRNKLEWIVIDYLQLVPFDQRMKKHDGIAEISHQVKLMAMELDIPVILLAQVNREGAKRETGLTLHDLKDSGDIENDADIILLMWPDGFDVDDARRLDVDMTPYISLKYNIAKNREGERDVKGTLKFLNQTGRFQQNPLDTH